MFMDDIKILNPDGISFEASTDLDEVIRTLGKDKIIEGNIDCRIIENGIRTIFSGKWDELRKRLKIFLVLSFVVRTALTTIYL